MKDHFRQLIASGKTNLVIQELLKVTARIDHSDLYDEVVMQAARFEKYTKEQRLGISSKEHQDLDIARINNALLDIIPRLPDHPIPSASERKPAVKIPTKKSIWLGIVALLGAVALFAVMVIFQNSLGKAGALGEMLFLLLLGILAGVAFFEFLPSKATGSGKVLGMNLNLSGPVIAGAAVAIGGYYFLQSAESGPFGFTVSLQNDPATSLSSNYPTLASAQLQLRLGDEWKTTDIDANGDADFKNIAGDYKNQWIKARLKARYWSLSKDSLLLKGKSQTLLLQPDGSLSKITGKVRDATAGQPLPGITVEVSGISTQTDKLGNFELVIPREKQRPEYSVNAFGEGFEAFKGTATPATGEPMSILLVQ